MATKREIPPAIKKIFDKDVQITKQFTKFVDRSIPVVCLTYFIQGVELTCHQLLWLPIVCWICFTWLYIEVSVIQINMVLGIFLAYKLVVITKAYAQRRRPIGNEDDALGQIDPEQFSFPSGHATGAAFITYFFLWLHPLSNFLQLFIIIWCTAVCVSRVMMNQHYLLDVVAGIVLGIFTGILIMGLLYVEEDAAKWLMNNFFHEKI